ncbi:MAG: type I-B CRISPR-associated protein Cas7/Csh2 [Epsilonproteobacteria bacterium]|nr:type I-B CRISPR-associated protein Cas7/Csh2 [Campylobacterota bacterium]NPA56161.1 type I-B CRISPR-associated protein Cas7/Csh2 [Campylobacterota bacterium]
MKQEYYNLNSEILYLYDCKECNPNGDPDNENKPRMDLATERALVSDVRLKRYVRDYLEQFRGKPIFVSKVEGRTVDATDRFASFIAELLLKPEYRDRLKKLKKLKGEPSFDELFEYIKKEKKWDLVSADDLLSYFIDTRLFGITLPIKDEKRGSSITFTGPVQFLWGYSLNKIELIESPSITSHFAGRTKGEGGEGGAIGKDWRIYYALIAFYGRISGNAAQDTGLTFDDVAELDRALWRSIETQTNTRTKLGQAPRLYLRIEWKDREYFIGDMRRYIAIDRKEGLRDFGEYRLDMGKLVERLKGVGDRIEKIVIGRDPELPLDGYGELERGFEGKIEEIL